MNTSLYKLGDKLSIDYCLRSSFNFSLYLLGSLEDGNETTFVVCCQIFVQFLFQFMVHFARVWRSVWDEDEHFQPLLLLCGAESFSECWYFLS